MRQPLAMLIRNYDFYTVNLNEEKAKYILGL